MPDEFEVIYLKNVKRAIAEIFERARKLGRDAEIVEILRLMDRQLRLRPREFGDPLASLAGLQLDLFARAVKPLIIYYGTHQMKRVVFINDIRILPFSGL